MGPSGQKYGILGICKQNPHKLESNFVSVAKYRYWIKKKSDKYRPKETTMRRNISPIARVPSVVSRRIVRTTTTTTTPSTTTTRTTTTTTSTTMEMTTTQSTTMDDHYFNECTTKINACRKNRTVNGFECQRWDVLYPHEPNAEVLSNLLRTDHNYCAPALSTDSRSWCYTKSKFKRWDYCDCKPKRKNCQINESDDLTFQRAPTPAPPVAAAPAFVYPIGPPAPPVDLQSKCGHIANPINIFKGFIEPFTIYDEYGNAVRDCAKTKMCKSNLHRSRRVTGGVKEEWLKVVGGNNAKNKNFPWQMSLMGPKVCGGTLVAMNVSLEFFIV